MIEKINQLKKDGKMIGFTCSTFDLLHAGHIAMLAEAKSYCDFLVVGLLTNPTTDRKKTKNVPVQSMFERWMQIQAVAYVDCVIPFESEQDLVDILLIIRPDVRICEEEYKGTNHTGHDIEGIKNIYNSRRHSFSTTELRSRVRNAPYNAPNLPCTSLFNDDVMCTHKNNSQMLEGKFQWA